MTQDKKPINPEEIRRAAEESGITEEQAKKFIAELTRQGVQLPSTTIHLKGLFCC